MDITILASEYVEASRNLLASLGVAIPEGRDVTVSVGGDAVRILHEGQSVYRAFPGYPTVIVGGGDGERMLPFPDSWTAVLEWAANPPTPAQASPGTFTPAEFMRLFTQDELDAVLAAEATDADVRRMWAFIRAVGYVNMADQLTENSLRMLREKAYIVSDERLQQIKDGLFQL